MPLPGHRSQVHASESLQSLLTVQPDAGSHAPSTHVSPAGQSIGSKKHPLVGSQLSTVQVFPSLQLIDVLLHVPPLHVSAVQALKSLHSLLKVQPPAD